MEKTHAAHRASRVFFMYLFWFRYCAYRARNGDADKILAIFCESYALLHVRYLLLLSLATTLGAQTNWTLRTIAGGTAAGDGGNAAEASIRFLQGVATDTAGNIYISDADDHRIRRIDSTGRITTLVGNGLPGFAGDGGQATAGRVNTPYGLCVTPLGDLIFADLGNARVRRITRAGVIETIAGGGTREIPPAGAFVPPLEVKLVAPRNVLATQSGSIFISDFGANRVLEIRSDGTLTSMPLALVDLNAPAGLTLDTEGNLVVADSGNARIRRLRRDGRLDILAVATADLPLERPVGLARASDGSLLVADTRGDFLWRLQANGSRSMEPIGGRDVTVDTQGNILTAGGSWLRRIDTKGLISIIISPAFSRYRGDGGLATLARLNRPTGVAVDSRGNVFFADTANHRVRRIGADGVITTVAGNGEPGYRGDGGLARESQLSSPTYVAVDAFDNVYVADTGNHRVRVFAVDGAIRTVLGNGRTELGREGVSGSESSVHSPQGIAFDRRGVLYVAERGWHRIRAVQTNGVVNTVVGTSLRGFSPNGELATNAQLNAPGAIALDSQANLYFVDSGNQALRVMDKATGRIRTLLSDVANAEGLAVTQTGIVYLAETQRHRVRMIELNGDLSVIAGRTNENGFNTDSGDALAVTLNEPAGLALDAEGALIVADRLNDRLRKLTPPAILQSGNLQAFRVVHAATFQEGALAPGQFATLLASDITNPALAQITFDSVAAPISFAGKTQINFQVPLNVAGRNQTAMELRVGGALVWRALLDVAGAAPAFFEANGGVIAVTPDGRLNSDTNPARAGDVLVLYGTGDGLQREVNGMTIPFLPVRVEVGGIGAELLYAGQTPGIPGLLQINLRVPPTLRGRGRVSVRITVGAFQNPNTQTIAIN